MRPRITHRKVAAHPVQFNSCPAHAARALRCPSAALHGACVSATSHPACVPICGGGSGEERDFVSENDGGCPGHFARRRPAPAKLSVGLLFARHLPLGVSESGESDVESDWGRIDIAHMELGPTRGRSRYSGALCRDPFSMRTWAALAASSLRASRAHVSLHDSAFGEFGDDGRGYVRRCLVPHPGRVRMRITRRQPTHAYGKIAEL